LAKEIRNKRTRRKRKQEKSEEKLNFAVKDEQQFRDKFDKGILALSYVLLCLFVCMKCEKAVELCRIELGEHKLCGCEEEKKNCTNFLASAAVLVRFIMCY